MDKRLVETAFIEPSEETKDLGAIIELVATKNSLTIEILNINTFGDFMDLYDISKVLKNNLQECFTNFIIGKGFSQPNSAQTRKLKIDFEKAYGAVLEKAWERQEKYSKK